MGVWSFGNHASKAALAYAHNNMRDFWVQSSWAAFDILTLGLPVMAGGGSLVAAGKEGLAFAVSLSATSTRIGAALASADALSQMGMPGNGGSSYTPPTALNSTLKNATDAAKALNAELPGAVDLETGVNVPYVHGSESGDFDLVTTVSDEVGAWAIEFKAGNVTEDVTGKTMQEVVEQSIKNSQAAWERGPGGFARGYFMWAPEINPAAARVLQQKGVPVVRTVKQVIRIITGK